jgi:NAD(P)-dependent dehydrogenase (short-subunit alcohol dehydrogenase family)
MLDDVLANWGRIDILINNPRIRPQAPLIDMDEWDWQRAIEMNLNGPFLVSQLVARQMRQQGQGIILNIIDRSALEQPSPGDAAYTAGQAGLLALSTAAAREFLASNIRVHTLCPEPSALAGGDALAGLAVRLCAPAARLPGQGYNLTRAPQNGQPQE